MTNVAIITPVYNTQDYLRRCLDSVLGQTGVTLQVFVVDDGSTDNSASIGLQYQKMDPRVTYIRKRNEGQGAARNLGIRLADAEFMYFVDSDDSLGDGALKILYDTAQRQRLDICSPKVPEHYFDKPLEYVGCLPCKSQFIRSSVIRDNGILQPSIRSGQDGVFSHLVLAHSRQIGMAANAVFHYTHAREGSTFAAHLKKHELVPGLIRQHHAAIQAHYDAHSLWERSAERLLAFVSEESLRNRLNPHYEHLTDAQRKECFDVLSKVAKKALRHVAADRLPYVPEAVVAIAQERPEELVRNYGARFLSQQGKARYPISQNVRDGDVLICRYSDKRFAPKSVMAVARAPESAVPALRGVASPRDAVLEKLSKDVRQLRGKLDLAINSINNAALQTIFAIRSGSPSLAGGIPGLTVSLTTLPSRLPVVHYAIESIFNQTVLPSRIVLWLTDRCDLERVLTPPLRALVDRGLEIRQVPDVGPHTKLIYALKESPGDCVVTVDDDVIYPANALQYLWEQHLKYPGAIVCNWARELAFGADGRVLGIRAGRLLTPPTLESEIERAHGHAEEPSLLAFPYGTSGVLYPPGALSEQVFDVDLFTRICPKEDDVWFKAMSLIKGTLVATTGLGVNPQHHCIVGSQHEALRHLNHGAGGNVEQMRAVFEHFGLYQLLATRAA